MTLQLEGLPRKFRSAAQFAAPNVSPCARAMMRAMQKGRE
jgi:hypothetical protein